MSIGSKVLIATTAALSVAAGVQTMRLHNLQLQHRQVLMDQKDKAIAARDAVLHYIEAVQKESGELRAQMAALEKEAQDAKQNADAAADRELNQRVQHKAELERVKRDSAEMARRAATDAQREASAQAIIVFSDLYGRCDARTAEFAAEADRARRAGETCERAYELVRERAQQWNEGE